jgi:glycosyltransferase involved in cell wall biosynthesis
VRYRCYNPAYDMRKLGHAVDVVAMPQFALEMVKNYDLFIFHKPPLHITVEAAILLIERQGKVAIADYDDLIFDKKNALSSSLFLTGRATEKIVLDIFKRNHRALKMFKHVTVSTTSLAEQVRHSHPEAVVRVVHNGLNAAWVKTARMRFNSRPVPGMISYFCGTKSHDHDFEIAEDVLAEMLHADSSLSLHVVGPLQFNRDKFPKSRLRLTAAVPYEDLAGLIMQSWISIAPLENNLFNRCKSGLKFFEAAAFGVPSVASPIPDMLRFEEGGIALVNTPDEWRDSLVRMAQPEQHRQVAAHSRDFAMNHCLSMEQTVNAIAFYRELGVPVESPVNAATPSNILHAA